MNPKVNLDKVPDDSPEMRFARDMMNDFHFFLVRKMIADYVQRNYHETDRLKGYSDLFSEFFEVVDRARADLGSEPMPAEVKDHFRREVLPLIMPTT